jgi:release factor glutamine methyltransferase
VTVLDVIKRSTEFLEAKGVESARLQVELLLAELLQLPRLQLYLNFERVLSESELGRMRERIRRRAAREPLQHILGSVNFCGCELTVNRAVLIPRPETELLAEHATRYLAALKETGVENPGVLDFGTGSGCLAIAIARSCASARIVALDVSAEALDVASANATRHQVNGRIRFVQSDRFAALGKEPPFHLLVTNPPYIPSDEIATLDPEVRNHDPRLALDGGLDGLDFYRELAASSPAFMADASRLMAEYGDGHAPAVRQIFEQAGWTIHAIEPDLSGRERFIIASPSKG